MSQLEAILESLNPEQKKAAIFGGPRLMVLAGAGSGKTKTLIARLAHFCHLGVPPEKLMAITFTNKAAREMKERLSTQIPHAGGAFVGTFHKISHLLLRRYGQYIHLNTNFQIITPTDQKRIVKEAIKELKITLDNQVSEYFLLKALSLRHQQVDVPYWLNETHRVGRVVAYYDNVCHRDNLLDFDMLIVKATELFKTPFVRDNFCQHLSHICIDEFQDTNYQQILWLEALLGENTGLTLVGDDDQSIYKFRGSDVTLMQTAQSRFDNLELIKLEQNYRSTSTIVNAANKVIEKNTLRLGKNLWTENITDDRISVLIGYNEFSEVEMVSQKIHHLLSQGESLGDIAILYRSNMQSRLFEAQARKFQWNYNLSGGLSFYDREEIKDVLSYLSLLVDKNSWLNISRVINKPSRKIGPKTLDKIKTIGQEYELMPWDALIASTGALKGKTLESLKGFIALIDEHVDYMSGMSLADLTSSLIAKSNILSSYSDNTDARSDNLYEMINAIIDYESKEDEGVPTVEILSRFLADVSLAGIGDVESEHEPHLTLSTVHAAKGLEWPYVFIVGMEEKGFPHARAQSDEDLDEERRLFYVALTRAKQKCWLSYASSRKKGYEVIRSKPSRYIDDITSEYLVFERSSAQSHTFRSSTRF